MAPSTQCKQNSACIPVFHTPSAALARRLDAADPLPPQTLQTPPSHLPQVGELEYSILGLEREISRRKRQEVKLQAKVDELMKGGQEAVTAAVIEAAVKAAPAPASDEHVSEADVAKVHEYRNEIQQLKQQLRKAHKALEREVGENVPLATILSSGSDGGWQGRAQQLALLKSKLAEAQLQLRHATPADSSATSPSGSPNSSVAAARRSAHDTDPRTRSNLRRIEKERRVQLEEVRYPEARRGGVEGARHSCFTTSLLPPLSPSFARRWKRRRRRSSSTTSSRESTTRCARETARWARRPRRCAPGSRSWRRRRTCCRTASGTPNSSASS